MPDHHRLSVVAWIVCRHNTRIVYSTAASKYVWGFSHYVEKHPHFHSRLWSLHFEFHLCFVFLFSILRTHKHAVPCGVCFGAITLTGCLKTNIGDDSWEEIWGALFLILLDLIIQTHLLISSLTFVLISTICTTSQYRVSSWRGLTLDAKAILHQTERATITRMIMLLRRLKLHCKWTVIGRCTSHIAQYVAE